MLVVVANDSANNSNSVSPFGVNEQIWQKKNQKQKFCTNKNNHDNDDNMKTAS